MSTLADNVRKHREAMAGEVSCKELDRRAGLGEGHVALIESGERRNVQLGTLQALATALGVGVDALIP